LQTLVYVYRLGIGRESRDWADLHAVPLACAIYIFLNEITKRLVVYLFAHFGIQKHSRRHSLPKQFQSARRSNFGLPCQCHDGIGLDRIVDDKEAPCPARKRNHDSHHQDEEN
jgi:hypothetical protein